MNEGKTQLCILTTQLTPASAGRQHCWLYCEWLNTVVFVFKTSWRNSIQTSLASPLAVLRIQLDSTLQREMPQQGEDNPKRKAEEWEMMDWQVTFVMHVRVEVMLMTCWYSACFCDLIFLIVSFKVLFFKFNSVFEGFICYLFLNWTQASFFYSISAHNFWANALVMLLNQPVPFSAQSWVHRSLIHCQAISIMRRKFMSISFIPWFLENVPETNK